MLAKIFAAALTTLFLTVSTCTLPVAASPEGNSDNRTKTEEPMKGKHSKTNGFRQRWVDFEKDPLKVLNEKKEKVQQLLSEGKITKEQADELNKRIDENIKIINDFNKLNLKQKKAMLQKQFNSSIDQRVKEGKMKKDFAEELKKDYQSKIEKWDGQGYPGFLVKGLLFKDKHEHGDKCPDKSDKSKPEMKEKPDSKLKPDLKQKPEKQQ